MSSDFRCFAQMFDRQLLCPQGVCTNFATRSDCIYISPIKCRMHSSRLRWLRRSWGLKRAMLEIKYSLLVSRSIHASACHTAYRTTYKYQVFKVQGVPMGLVSSYQSSQQHIALFAGAQELCQRYKQRKNTKRHVQGLFACRADCLPRAVKLSGCGIHAPISVALVWSADCCYFSFLMGLVYADRMGAIACGLNLFYCSHQ